MYVLLRFQHFLYDPKANTTNAFSGPRPINSPFESWTSLEESQPCVAAVAPHGSLRLSRDNCPSGSSLLTTWLAISAFEANLMQPRRTQEGWRGRNGVRMALLPLSSQALLFSAFSLSELLARSPRPANEEYCSWDVFVLL